MRAVVHSLLLCLLLGCASPASNPRLAWQFDLHLDEHDQPNRRLWLVVDGERHLITDDPVGGDGVLPRADYKQYQIPDDAVLARSGWWAGEGEDMYVRVKSNRILVFRREYGEASPGIPPYSLFRTIAVRQTANWR